MTSEPTFTPPATPVDPENAKPLFSEFAGDGMMVELLQMYTRDLSDQAGQLKDALEAEDRAALAALAQQVRDSASHYGFPPITRAAMAVEQYARVQADAKTLQGSVTELINLCHRASAGS